MKLELRSVRIKNCGPIDDIKIDFFDASGKTLPVCVIGGANGSGKTTVLEAIWGVLGIITHRNLQGKISEKIPEYLQANLAIDGKDCSLFYRINPIKPNDAVLLNEYFGLIRDFKQQPGIQWEGTPFLESFRQTILLQLQQNDPQPSNFSENSVPSIIYLPHNRSLEPVYGQQLQKEDERYEFTRLIETVRQFP